MLQKVLGDLHDVMASHLVSWTQLAGPVPRWVLGLKPSRSRSSSPAGQTSQNTLWAASETCQQPSHQSSLFTLLSLLIRKAKSTCLYSRCNLKLAAQHRKTLSTSPCMLLNEAWHSNLRSHQHIVVCMQLYFTELAAIVVESVCASHELQT